MRKYLKFLLLSLGIIMNLNNIVFADVQANTNYAQKGWVQVGGRWKYNTGQAGYHYTNTKVSIDGVNYIFDSSGYMVTQNPYTYQGTVYSISSSGAATMAKGWIKQGSNWYLYYTGTLQKNKWSNYNGDFPSNSYSSNTCYYAGSDGKMLANTTQNIGGTPYKFDASGKATANITTISKDDVNSIAKAGWSGDSIYDVSGKKITNKWANSAGQISDKYDTYSFFYYLDSNGNRIKSKTTAINGDSYSFDANGKATKTTSTVTVTSINGWQQEQGKWRYYKNNAYLKNIWINDNGATEKNFTPSRNIHYYLGSDGYMLVSQTRVINSIIYSFDKNGIATQGTQNNQDISSYNEYQKEFYNNGYNKTKTSSQPYFADTFNNGKYIIGQGSSESEALKALRNKITVSNSQTFILDKVSTKTWPGEYKDLIENSYIINLNQKADGWRSENGNWYYYKNGIIMVNQWIGNYYLGSDGKMLTNTWTPDGYYVEADGKWDGNAKQTQSTFQKSDSVIPINPSSNTKNNNNVNISGNSLGSNAATAKRQDIQQEFSIDGNEKLLKFQQQFIQEYGESSNSSNIVSPHINTNNNINVKSDYGTNTDYIPASSNTHNTNNTGNSEIDELFDEEGKITLEQWKSVNGQFKQVDANQKWVNDWPLGSGWEGWTSSAKSGDNKGVWLEYGGYKYFATSAERRPEYEQSNGDTKESTQYGYIIEDIAKDCTMWIGTNIYRFDSNGVAQQLSGSKGIIVLKSDGTIKSGHEIAVEEGDFAFTIYSSPAKYSNNKFYTEYDNSKNYTYLSGTGYAVLNSGSSYKLYKISNGKASHQSTAGSSLASIQKYIKDKNCEETFETITISDGKESGTSSVESNNKSNTKYTTAKTINVTIADIGKYTFVNGNQKVYNTVDNKTYTLAEDGEIKSSVNGNSGNTSGAYDILIVAGNKYLGN